eukprot:superscaffoldBa00006966_g22089
MRLESEDRSVGTEPGAGAARRRTAAGGEERGPWAPLRPPTGSFTWTWTAGFRRNTNLSLLDSSGAMVSIDPTMPHNTERWRRPL